MGALEELAGAAGTAAAAAVDPVAAVLNLGTSLIDCIWPDPATRDKARLALLELQQHGALQELAAAVQSRHDQAAIDLAEAKRGRLIDDWRDGLGWACVCAYVWQFVAAPLASFTLAALGHAVSLPQLNFGGLDTLLFGMLGIGGAKTLEKIKG